MTTIPYTYTIISVQDRTMDVEYANPVHGTMLVGVRKPKLGETVEQVVAEYSPAVWWAEAAATFAEVAVGATGAGETVFPEPPIPLTAQQQLEAWRANTSISKFQAHETLRTWGIYDQVVAIVAAIGDPVQRAFHDAGEWMRNSQTIIALFSMVTMPDGSTPTEAQLDQFFTEAEAFII